MVGFICIVVEVVCLGLLGYIDLFVMMIMGLFVIGDSVKVVFIFLFVYLLV